MFRALNNLSIRFRLLLATFLFLMTLFVAMFQAYVSIGANVDFAVAEMKGNKYQRPVARMLADAGDIRLLAAVKQNGVAVDQGEITSLADSISRELANLKKVNDEIGIDLQFTEKGLSSRGRDNLAFAKIESKWNDLSGKLAGSTGVTDDEIASFIADMRGLIAHSGDTSNLILDPDLDSYYLMDVTLLALPQTLDRLTVIAKSVYPLLATGYQATQQNHTDTTVMARMLKEADMDRVAADMDTSFKEDPNFYGTSPTYANKAKPALESYLKANTDLTVMLTSIGEGKPVTQEQFVQAWKPAHKSAHEFLNLAYDELDAMLANRIDVYKGKQTEVILQSLAGIILSMLFYLYVAGTISKPVKALTNVMDELSGDRLDIEVPYKESRSDIGRIAKAIGVFHEGLLEKRELQKQLEREQNEKALNKGRAKAEKQEHINRSIQENMENIQHIAAAMEEMVASISEIGRQEDQSMSVMAQAKDAVSSSEGKIVELKKLTEAIGSVISLIADISTKTNLLALNATIESARAGEYGKGFAVVAGEVKVLAAKTTEATEEISSQISQIQVESGNILSAIEELNRKFNMVNEITGAVCAAIEEQRVVSQEISQRASAMAVVSGQLVADIESLKNMDD